MTAPFTTAAATESPMTRPTAPFPIATAIADFLNSLLGRPSRPNPVLVPVAIRRPTSIRVPVERR